jgi:hypothetical protein
MANKQAKLMTKNQTQQSNTSTRKENTCTKLKDKLLKQTSDMSFVNKPTNQTGKNGTN